MSKPKRPADLDDAGKVLWDSIAGKYELRADEIRVLLDGCREADLIATLDEGLKGQPLLVRGSQGQEVIHPLISELRQHRSTLSALLRQLKLPDDGATSDSGGELSAKNRAAANERWSRRGS